jgi:hypothetical protein
MNKKCYLLLFVFFTTQNFYADFDSFLEETKVKVQNAKDITRYYGRYAVAGAVVSAGFAKDYRAGLGALCLTGLWGISSAIVGYLEIKQIKQKYTVKTRQENAWHSYENASESEPFSFARWRQQDDVYGDGYYWPTAWLMQEEPILVRRYFLHDLYSQRFIIRSNERLINRPRPDQVVAAINDEIAELERDKLGLKPYTTVYLQFEQAEAAKPDISYWRLLWPNYNTASKLYIEIVTMLKRLEVLRDIVATVRAEVPGGGWPQA